MALADSITALGTAIINLVGTRLNRDANNFSTAGTQNLNSMIDGRIGAVTGAPVGTVIAYMGTDEPEGFLLMDGRELSRTTYAALFAVIGTSQGAGDGSTTFNIADMTDGRYLMGSTVAGTSQSPCAPQISGTIANLVSQSENMDSKYHSVAGTGAFKETQNGDRCTYSIVTNSPNEYDGFDFRASRNSSIYGRGDTIRPLSKTCKFLIRYM